MVRYPLIRRKKSKTAWVVRLIDLDTGAIAYEITEPTCDHAKEAKSFILKAPLFEHIEEKIVEICPVMYLPDGQRKYGKPLEI